MTLNTKYISIAVLAILIIGFGALYLHKNQGLSDGVTITSTSTSPDVSRNIHLPSKTPTSSTPPVKVTIKGVVLIGTNTSGFLSYGNAEYNFTIKFPKYTQTRNAFSTFHDIGNNWRLNAASANQGKGILELSIFSIDQGGYSTGNQKYPLYFTALVRVGAGPNVKECYTPDAGYTNQKITTVQINGVTFKKFSSGDAGMMKYTQAESYRTIHNNMCFVIEQIKSGSSYRDEKMAPGIADSALTNYYSEGATIIQTFKFTK